MRRRAEAESGGSAALIQNGPTPFETVAIEGWLGNTLRWEGCEVEVT